MQKSIEIIDVLYQFVLKTTLYFIPNDVHTVEPNRTYSVVVGDPVRSIPDIVLEDGVQEAVPGATTFRGLDEILSGKEAHALSIEKNTSMYVGSDMAPLYKNPTREFDGAVEYISYGAMVTILGFVGRFAHVAVNGVEGFLVREDLVDRASYVYPEFVVGEENDVDDTNTVRLRAIIKDEFGAGSLEFPLQAGEYISYRLFRKGIVLAWPKVRPRMPGRWHVLLRGIFTIHVGVTPKTGAVMEYVLEHDMGHLAYVEAVFPDETISISEVNYPDSGRYSERTLTRDEWRELKPIFIHVRS